MLRNGTRITNADVCQPNSVGTAMNIAMQIMASISASQYGGVSLPNFNEVFAEYAKKNFKKKHVVTCKKNKYTIKKLAGKKTYYVKARAFKKNNKKKIYGSFSKTIKVKVKA